MLSLEMCLRVLRQFPTTTEDFYRPQVELHQTCNLESTDTSPYRQSYT